MDSIWTVLGLALLPALGNFMGGMLAELFVTNQRRLSNALHAAAGIVIAIVSVELMPEALEKISAWQVAVAFGLGGLTYIAIDSIVGKLQGASEQDASGKRGMWMIYIAVSMDLFSDGLMIGAGSAVSFTMALTLALGQVLADVPEGYATIANMKAKGVPRGRRIFLSASFAIPVLAASVLAYFLLRENNEVWQMGALSFTAGLLTLAAVEDMISEAHETVEDTRASLMSFTAGFIIFTLVSAGMEVGS
ncbi:ZIP family metal transporter [Nitrosovibrio sp. Nv6]|uniref:ZIP family metal transporter n=1 Tax=Nitrosovibrio sp. Nv6 TaxID=1855340 RepID=UPI0008CA1B26|nr:peptidoglycan-binding protein [Nitrosovibrio sp. Nv6]SEP43586.1 zinc transporter, ZIP family [Nitrosovibrio sp. Nv6]